MQCGYYKLLSSTTCSSCIDSSDNVFKRYNSDVKKACFRGMGVESIFSRGEKMVEFYSTHSELSKQPFLLTN